MSLKIEHIGSWWRELLSSRYVKLLERENTRLRLENERLLNKILEMAERPVSSQVVARQAVPMGNKPVPGRKTWAQIQAEAVEANARAEEAEAKKEQSNGIQG